MPARRPAAAVPVHARSEGDRIAGIDGVTAVAQLMRQADLPKLGVTLLGTEQIGHPDAGAMARHHLGDHAGGTAVRWPWITT